MLRATAWRLALAVRAAVLAALVASVHLQVDTAASGTGHKLALCATGEGIATPEPSFDEESARAPDGTADSSAPPRDAARTEVAQEGNAPLSEGLSGWTLAPHGKTWEQIGETGSIRVLVCMPTMRRRDGISFVERTLSAVRGHESPLHRGAKIREHVLVLHDEDYQPPGADFYLWRKPHNIVAPCSFMRWRRALVLDFKHMMLAAIEIMESGGNGAGAGEYILWLEDDALLHQGWKETLHAKLLPELARKESPACLFALHQCNCERCSSKNHYNGIGAVAILIHRRWVSIILDALSKQSSRDFRPLDHLLGDICKLSEDQGGPRAWYMTPPLVTHLGDIVLGTTKPQLPTAAKFIYPRQAQIVPSPAVGTPLMIKMLASGLVYDAEYTWRAFINGVPASEKQSIKLMSPRLESECSEIPSMEVFVVVNQLAGDPYFLSVELIEEESGRSQVVGRDNVTIFVSDRHEVGLDEFLSPEEVEAFEMSYGLPWS